MRNEEGRKQPKNAKPRIPLNENSDYVIILLAQCGFAEKEGQVNNKTESRSNRNRFSNAQTWTVQPENERSGNSVLAKNSALDQFSRKMQIKSKIKIYCNFTTELLN